MAHPLEDRLGLIVLGSTLSTTGKYWIAIGHHWKGAHQCHDVISVNQQNGEIIKRHYKSKEEALIFWETFYQQMTAPRGPSEEDECDPMTIIKPS